MARINFCFFFFYFPGLFGLLQYGVDLNGFVRHPEKGICVWMQRRAKTKQTWPGRMDNFVSKE